MTGIPPVHGIVAVLVLAAFIFAEETGVPIPFAPGDLMLVSAGVLIATGTISPWFFFPFALVASSLGAFVGYTWARHFGAGWIRALARRMRQQERLDRLERRIASTGVGGIMIARLFIPAMRVYTSLLAGALGVGRRTFVAALIPSAAIWIAVFTSLGILVGVPIDSAIHRLDHSLISGAELLGLGVTAFLAARFAPGGGGRPVLPGRARMMLSIATDAAVIFSIIAGIDLIARHSLGLPGIDDIEDLVVSGVLTVGAYFLVARGLLGGSPGETLFGTTYRHRRGNDNGEPS